MEPTRVLGAYHYNGQPKTPVYALGKVIERGKDIGKGKNHADSIDDNGDYDVVALFSDFRRSYPTLFAVAVWQLAPHMTPEVDCEFLFHQAGFLSDPRCGKSNIRKYERLVMGKHWLQRIHCSVPKII